MLSAATSVMPVTYVVPPSTTSPVGRSVPGMPYGVTHSSAAVGGVREDSALEVAPAGELHFLRPRPSRPIGLPDRPGSSRGRAARGRCSATPALRGWASSDHVVAAGTPQDSVTPLTTTRPSGAATTNDGPSVEVTRSLPVLPPSDLPARADPHRREAADPSADSSGHVGVTSCVDRDRRRRVELARNRVEPTAQPRSPSEPYVTTRNRSPVDPATKIVPARPTAIRGGILQAEPAGEFPRTRPSRGAVGFENDRAQSGAAGAVRVAGGHHGPVGQHREVQTVRRHNPDAATPRVARSSAPLRS